MKNMNIPDDIQNKIYQFVKENTFKDSSKIDNNTKLFDEGFFDSMGFALLIDFLEENFRVSTMDEDMVENNFKSINAITQYVLKKQS